MKKYIKLLDIIVVSIILVCTLAVTGLYAYDGAEYAVIYVNGNEYGRYSLGNPDRQTIDVYTEYGYNIVIVEDKKVWVSESDCKDKIEINAGKISRSGQSLVCLPNRLVVTVEGRILTDATAF